MKFENCKDCAYLEYHDEVKYGNKYKGYYCGDFYNLTENANIENIDECEWADYEEECEMRRLTDEEKEIYLENREVLHEQLCELQADLEDLSDELLIECRLVMLSRVNLCLQAILETDEDNID